MCMVCEENVFADMLQSEELPSEDLIKREEVLVLSCHVWKNS